ncbi:hypothetical protein [Saccharopolyspora sp. NPDC049426]|uniref:hypothetical protein n=1 Tax=Saccharopolyspora sp. NPDC049426 TaxID=3155652 RepID=UPI003446AC10
MGVIAPDLANPPFNVMLEAFNSRAASAGIRILVVDTGGDADEEIEVSRSLQRHVDGLVLASPRMRLYMLEPQ